MLTRCRGEGIAHDLEPQPCERTDTARLACLLVLRVQRLLHLAPMVGAEVKRKEAHEHADEPLGAGPLRDAWRTHTDLGLVTSFFVRAISTSASSRSISAAATFRPNGVNR